MDVRIVLPESILQAERLKQSLWVEFAEQNNVKLIPGVEDRYRGVDPTILVAIVSAAGGALSAFIAGLLRCAQKAHSGKIIIQKGDKRIEITTGISEKELERAADFFYAIEDETAIITFH